MQYLLNTTAIWLLSLIVFDIFLRRENYHQYNRLYLLMTLLLGIALPMIQWQANDIIQHATVAGPISSVLHTKQVLIQATTIESKPTFNWMQWLWVAYYTGVAISALLFLKDAYILSRYFKSGSKYKDGNWCIVETGRQHSPFSVFKHIFISNKNNYQPNELHMILAHEKQHGSSLHIIDTIMISTVKIFFWFHPLVYLFQKRLLILHEYQADEAVENELPEYGGFLIRQSMLQAAPSLSHSLNRSPIKKRIVMLTRTTSFMAGFKRLVAIPLCIACVFLFTQHATSKNAGNPSNTFQYNGNTFELKPKKFFPDYIMNSAQYNVWLNTTGIPDTITMQNPRTGLMEATPAFIIHYPATMNGRQIFAMGDLPKAEQDDIRATTIAEVNKYLLEKLAPVINEWEKGYYDLYEYLVIDESGKIVYMHPPKFDMNELTPLTQERMKSLEQKLLEITVHADKKFTPAKHNGRNEIIRLDRQALQIKKKTASIIEPGC